jgi:pimeloyl-ACP methyl ester carboxylesterase
MIKSLSRRVLLQRLPLALAPALVRSYRASAAEPAAGAHADLRQEKSMSGEVTHRTVVANGIHIHVAEQGQGPLVLLCHGWPECWYSWRHQLSALAAAGFHAVAPDMRGFGRTDAPGDVSAYDILHNVGDMVQLVIALGEQQAVIVGHDWGAPVAWASAMIRHDIFRAVIAMSVPNRARGPVAPLQALRDAGITTFYVQYFQAPGVAEAELERDVATTMRRLLYTGSGDAPAEKKVGLVLKPDGGLLDNLLEPTELPKWLTADDLAVFVAEYKRTGFRGGLNWYRNIDRNWELLAPWDGIRIRQPALFVGGTEDGLVKRSAKDIEQLPTTVPGLKRTLLISGAGHWIQQERPAEVNAAILDFLRAL